MLRDIPLSGGANTPRLEVIEGAKMGLKSVDVQIRHLQKFPNTGELILTVRSYDNNSSTATLRGRSGSGERERASLSSPSP